LKELKLSSEEFSEKVVTVVSQSQLASKLGLQPEQTTASTLFPKAAAPPIFKTPEDQKVAQIAFQVIRKMENQPHLLPSVTYLANKDVQAALLNEVSSQYRPSQLEIEGVTPKPDFAAIIAKTSEMVIQQTIDIPRILLVPTGKIQSGFNSFTLKVDAINYPPVSEELWAKYLRTDQVDVISTGKGGIEELRLEDYVVSGLVDFDDVSYDSHADLLYDLAGQVVQRLRSYLPDEHEVRKVLGCHKVEISRFVHAQMLEHYWEKATGYEVKISKGFSDLKTSAYTASEANPVLDYRPATGGQKQYGQVSVRRVQVLPLPGAEIPVRHRAQAVSDYWNVKKQSGSSPPKASSRFITSPAPTTPNTSRTSWPKRTTQFTCWSRRRKAR
jgi:type III restriction enzyme